MSKQESARIPRRKTEGLLEEVKLNSPEGQSILADIKRTCFDTNYEDKFWKIEKIEIVSNFVLEKRYEDKKRELKEQGRKGKELEEHLMFLSEQGYNLSTVVKDGCKTGTKKRHVLGYTKSGVHLHRNLDILVRFMTFKNFSSPGHIIVFKSILGRSKALKPMIKSAGATYLEPTPNCDSHVSSEKVQPTMSVCEALNYTYVYFYEYDEDTGLPVVYPRHVVPYAVLTLCRLPGVIHGGPFLAVNSPNWRWEVKGETRNGFRWARVNADSPDSDTKLRRGKSKKSERSIPNKDTVSIDLDQNLNNMGLKGQSVSISIKKYQCTKDDASSHLTNEAPDLAEEVCIPSEVNEIKDFSCSLSIAKQVSQKESLQLSKINDIERLIDPESRCHINNSPTADECVRTNKEESQEKFDQDKFGDKLCQQSSIVSNLKASETDNKNEMRIEEKYQKSKNSNAEEFQTILMHGHCRKPILLHTHAPSLGVSLYKDCPVQMHTEEIRKSRELLLSSRSIHTSSLASIPFALINPCICLRRVDEDYLKSQKRDHCRFVVGNSSLSTSVSSFEAKKEDMSTTVKTEVHTTAMSDSSHLECYSNTNSISSTKMSPDNIGVFHSQLQPEEGRLNANTSPLVSPETSCIIGQLHKHSIKESCLDIGNSLSVSAISVQAKEDMPSVVKHNVNTAVKSDSGSKQSNSNTDPAYCAGIFSENVIFHSTTDLSLEQGKLEASAPCVSPEISYVVGKLQKPPPEECCLEACNSSLLANVMSIKAVEDMSFPVKTDVCTAEKSDSTNKVSNYNTDSKSSTRQSPDQAGTLHSIIKHPRDEGKLETCASLFVSSETSYIIGQIQNPPSKEILLLDVGNSSLSTNVISEKAKEKNMSSSVKNELHIATQSNLVNKQSNSNRDPTSSNGNSPEQGRLQSTSPFVSRETSYVAGQLKYPPSTECCLAVKNSVLSTSVISTKSVDDMSSPVKKDANIAAESDSGNMQINSYLDSACCAGNFPAMAGIFHSNTQIPREEGKLETRTTPFVTLEASFGQFPKPLVNKCFSDVGNTSLSASTISDKAKEEDMSSGVKNDMLTAAQFNSVSQQCNSNTDPACSAIKSPGQVGVIFSSPHFPREQIRSETNVLPPFVSLEGQLQKTSSNESCIPQKVYRPSTLANMNIKKQSFATAHKSDMNETCIKEDAMDKGGETLSRVCTKKTDTDILSNTCRSRDFQTYCDGIISTPSIETRIPTQDSLDISARDSGHNSYHFGYSQACSMQPTHFQGTGIKYEHNAHFNGPRPFQVNTSSSLFRPSSLPQSARVRNRIPWNEYHRLIRDNYTPSLSAQTDSNILHTAHKNTMMDVKNPVNSGLLCMEGKAEKTRNTTSSISSCTVAEGISPVDKSATLSEFQIPFLTKENIGSVFLPNRGLTSHACQSVNAINNRGIVFPGDVSTFDRYIIEMAWKQLRNVKQTPEMNLSDNEMPRKSCFDTSRNCYPDIHIPEIANLKVSKDPRLRPRADIHFKDAPNTVSHEKIATDRTSKGCENSCDLNAYSVAYTGTCTELRKVNNTDNQDQKRASEEEISDGTPTYDEKDYSAESDFIQGVGHENFNTVPIKPKETDVDIVNTMVSCSHVLVKDSVIADTKRIDESQQIIVTPIKDESIKSRSSDLKEKANKKETQLNSNPSKQETTGHQVNDYQVEITKTLLELSAIVNAIQSRQERASKAKDAKSPILGGVTSGQNIEKRDAPASKECTSYGEQGKFDSSTRTISLCKDNNNIESIKPIHSRSSNHAHCAKSVISEKKDGMNRSKRGNKSLPLIRRHNERAMNKCKALPLSEKNDNVAATTPENKLQSTLKTNDFQVSFVDTPSPSKDQSACSHETTLQTSLHKLEFPEVSEKGAGTAKEKEQTKSLATSIRTSETEKQCNGMTVETFSTAISQSQEKTPSSNVSPVMISNENIQFDKHTKSLDMAHKWRPIAPVGDSKAREMDFSGTHSRKCQGLSISYSKPSTNRNDKVGADRKDNAKVEILLKSNHFVKDTAYSKTNSPIVLSPPVNHGASPIFDLTLKCGEITAENSLKKMTSADAVGNVKDVGSSCERSTSSKTGSDSRSESLSVNYRKSSPYIDSSSDKETIHCSNEGVTQLSAIKDLQFSSELVKGPSCSSKDVSVSKCNQNEDSNVFSIIVESTVRKPKVSDTYSNWKRTDALRSNSMGKKNNKAVQYMDINSNSDCNDGENAEPMNKRESLSTDPSLCNVLSNGQGLNCSEYKCGSMTAIKAAKMIQEQSLYQDEDNNHRKKLNRFTSKTMDKTQKRLNENSSGLKDTNISLQETSCILMRNEFTSIGTKHETNERKAVDDITKREETQEDMNFQEKERFKINSSHEEIQCVRGRVPSKHQFLIDNKGVKRIIRRDIERPARSSVHCKLGRQTHGKSQNSLKQTQNASAEDKDSDEDEVSCKNNFNRREPPFITNEKESREKSTSTVRSSSLSSDYQLNPKRRRCDDTKLHRNDERAISVSSSDRQSNASSHSRNRSLSSSVSGSRNSRESSSELSPIRNSGYIPPRYLNPYFKLWSQCGKQRFSHFHKSSQKQYIEKQKQKVFQKCKYNGNFRPKGREHYMNGRRFVYLNNVDERRQYDFPESRGSNLSMNGPGSKHHGNYIKDSDDKFQTRPCKRFVHLPDNTYRNPLKKMFLSRKKISYEHYANRDANNQNDDYQSSNPLIPNGGFHDIGKRHRYLNGHSNGCYGNRGFSSMRAKRTDDDDDDDDHEYDHDDDDDDDNDDDDDDDDIKHVKRRKMYGYKTNVDDTEHTDTNTNDMNEKRKKKVKKQKYSIDIGSHDCDKQISMNSFSGGKSRLDMNNDQQINNGRLEHSLYKDKFGALHERLDKRCSKQHVESYEKSKHISKKDQISNFDDPDRSVRPRIRLRERIFDALERYRNAFESSDPSEVDEEIVRCLNFLCKKINVSGPDRDTTDHVNLNQQRRQKNKYLERVLHTYPQNVHRRKVSFYEHVVNTIRVMQRHASEMNMPNSIEVVRSQFSNGNNKPTLKHHIPAKMKRKQNVMNKQLKERQIQPLKKQQTHLQIKRKTNFDFANTNFRHGRAFFGKQRTGTKQKQKC